MQHPPIAAGIDTWSVAWYLRDGGDESRAAGALATVKQRRSRAFPDTIEGHRILWFEDARMLKAEGHPKAGDLAPADPSFLAERVEALAVGLADYGVTVPKNDSPFDRTGSPGFAGVNRLDSTVDLERSPEVGRAILTGIAAVPPPGRLKTHIVRQEAGRAIETVSWVGRTGVMARAYDKGVESGSHRFHGERVRFEDQRRWPAGHRRTLEELTPSYVGDTFRRRFAPVWRATRGVTVTGVTKAA